MNLNERDKKIIWHPFTQEKISHLPIEIKSASGSYLYDNNNKQYLDLISSWWVNLHGHAHPEIAKAIYKQALTLEHVIFAGFTHEPAVQLCEKLQTLLPQILSRFFFSDNGSSAIEVAIKMAYQYWRNNGENERVLFLSFDGGYHGDTFGSMSVSIKSGFHDQFTKLLFSVLTIPFPDSWNEDAYVEQKERLSLDALTIHLKNHAKQIAALVLEPLVQGAAGMRMCRPTFVQNVVNLVRSYNILVIFDEIMTGFGRTGTYFALEQTNIIPDFLCLSKGLSGGFLPIALTITTETIYNAFSSDDYSKTFLHGHSYSANPLGCAAAIASLDLLTRPETMRAIASIYKTHQEGMILLQNICNNVKNIRILGSIAAFELQGTYTNNMNEALKSRFLEDGLLIRPLNNVIYLLPPYCIKIAELAQTYEKICKILHRI
jgi:adenosylmethionine-8-amino-7-oxononanoate aminotransferase